MAPTKKEPEFNNVTDWISATTVVCSEAAINYNAIKERLFSEDNYQDHGSGKHSNSEPNVELK